MSTFDRGVSFYDQGELLLMVSFPEGDRACKWCPFCRKDNDVRFRCPITNRILFTVNTIPNECPIIFKEDTNHEIV
jgi:hypothetical protein